MHSLLVDRVSHGRERRINGLFLCLVLALNSTALLAGLPAPWRFQHPLPQGNDLRAAWAAAPDQLYVGGHGGTILHWNGTRWSAMPTPTQKTIFALHGTSSTDLWAVGGDPYTDDLTNRCLILHFDGTVWTEQAAPQFWGNTYSFNAVHALAPNDVWATQDGGTYLAHFDGTRWEWVSVPLGIEGTLKAIASAGADHLFVAGSHGQILHRDQGVWRLEQKLESGNFSFNLITRLWAYDADHVFAAGNWTQFYRRRPDGTWESLPVAASEPFGIEFLALWGRSPSEVYLLGMDAVFHYDGVHPATRTSLSGRLRQSWITGCGVVDRLYGVGPAGVAHEYLPAGPEPGDLSPLTVGGHARLCPIIRGITPVGPEAALVYGTSRWQPHGWPVWYVGAGAPQRWPHLPPGASADVEFSAVVGRDLRDLTVAWNNADDGRQGLHHWNGAQWTALSGAPGARYLWRSSAGRLHAAGHYWAGYQNEQGSWITSHTVPPDSPEKSLTALWGRSDQSLFLATRNGQILHFNGTAWTAESTPGEGVITALAGTATETYAVGEGGLAWRRVGTQWQPLSQVVPRSGEDFSAVVAAPDGVYAAQRTPAQFIGGGLGRVWRFHGATATLVVQGLSRPLEALTCTETGHLLGVASDDAIVTTAPSPDGLALERVNLASAAWQTVGSRGVAVRADAPQTSHPVVAVHRVEGAPPLASAPLQHREHWFVLGDQLLDKSALPPLFLRLTYNPARLPAAWADLPLSLFRSDGGEDEVLTQFDASAHMLSTLAPVQAPLWSLGPATAPPRPRLAIHRSAATPQITLSWPTAAGDCVLESCLDGPGQAVWSPVQVTPVIVGDLWTVPWQADQERRFFRLRTGTP